MTGVNIVGAIFVLCEYLQFFSVLLITFESTTSLLNLFGLHLGMFRFPSLFFVTVVQAYGNKSGDSVQQVRPHMVNVKTFP